MASSSAVRAEETGTTGATPATYTGSTYNEVRNAVLSDPYTTLPDYKVTIGTFFEGGKNILWRDSQWLLANNDDLTAPRQKLVNPLGICFFGRWKITEETPYTGALRTGTDYLTIVRCSNLLTAKDRGKRRSFGIAAKIFPTLDPNERVKTANANTLTDFAGMYIDRFTDGEFTNEPPVVPNLGLLSMILVVIEALWVFLRADSPSTHRPLYPLAELALRPGETPKAPKWLQFTADPSCGKNDSVDFRDELRLGNYKDGKFRWYIAVADTETNGKRNWRRIGQIDLDGDVISASGDNRIRFRHDPNKGHATDEISQG